MGSCLPPAPQEEPHLQTEPALVLNVFCGFTQAAGYGMMVLRYRKNAAMPLTIPRRWGIISRSKRFSALMYQNGGQP